MVFVRVLVIPLLAEKASRARGKVKDFVSAMKMFNTAEFFNRGVAYLGAKAKGRDLGLKGRELEDYALDVVDRTQFRYTRADPIRGLQQTGPLGAAAPVIGQFKTYPLKQFEFIWNEIVGNLRSDPGARHAIHGHGDDPGYAGPGISALRDGGAV